MRKISPCKKKKKEEGACKCTRYVVTMRNKNSMPILIKYCVLRVREISKERSIKL